MTLSVSHEPQAPAGVDTRERQRLKRTFYAFIGAILLLACGVATGRASVDAAALIVAQGLLGYAVFYLLLQKQEKTHSPVRTLIFPHVLFTISQLSLTFALVEASRATVLQLLCVVVVFDMHRLPLSQTVIAATASAVMPAVAVLMQYAWSPESIDIEPTLIYLCLGGLAIPVLIVVSTENRSLNRKASALRNSLSSALDQLRHLSLHDSMTGAYNRAHIEELLTTELRRLSRTTEPASLAMLDLDYFKRVNDLHGHGMGDIVLKRFANIVRDIVDGTEYSFGRWGGEEFLLLMPGESARGAEQVLTRLHEAIRMHDWAAYGGPQSVSVSVGAVELVGHMSPTQAVAAADQALYQAKAAGRKRTVWADASTPRERDVIKLRATADPPSAKHVEAPRPKLSDLLESTQAAPVASSGLSGAFLDMVLSKQPQRRRQLRMILIVSGMYFALIATGLLWPLPEHVLPQGLWLTFTVIESLGAVVPYALARSGLTSRWKPISLVVIQMMWACAAAVLGYALVPVARAYCLQLLCVTLVFGFTTLRPRQAVLMGRTVVAMLILGYAAMFYRGGPGFDAVEEGLVLIGTVAVLSQLTVLSRNFGSFRQKVSEQAGNLALATAQLTQALRIDPLTQLPNRTHMQALLEQEVLRHSRSARTFSIALMDLDHFKAVNDSYGHGAGDSALKSFAKVAKSAWRETDVIARWGGEEFLVLLPDAHTLAQAQQGLDRVRAALESNVVSAEHPTLRIKFSAGIAQHQPHETLSSLLERADRALYEAKARGRDQDVRAGNDGPPSTPPFNGNNTYSHSIVAGGLLLTS